MRDGFAIDEHLSACGIRQAAYHIKAGCLAGAVWSEKSYNLSAFEPQ
jgi:hypothetical protein